MNIESQKPDILIIDDELQVRRLLRITLEDSGFCIGEAETGAGGLAEAARHTYDIIILDLGLPDLHGVEVLRRIREWSAVPVLILSVFGNEKDKIQALDSGADDYLTKPFGSGELLARLRVLLRRPKPADSSASHQFGSVSIDLAGRSVSKQGAIVKLTPQEYALLRLLVIHRDKVVTHGQITREICSPSSSNQMQYLRVLMMRLRRKLEDDPDAPCHLISESGIGYRFVTEPISLAPRRR